MKVDRYFKPGDRYEYDFKRCNYKTGWAQLDTSQDAWYYGNWVNPLTFELMSYCEGDVTHTRCDDENDFKVALADTIKWQRESGYFKGIDAMCDENLIAAFGRLGFQAELH
jgi:hypothetical protein